MNSEKVKEIKTALKCCSTPLWTKCDNCSRADEDSLCMYRLQADALTLINELESENIGLKNQKKEFLALITGQENIIAELEEYIKGNEQDAKAFVNGWHKDLETELKQFAERLKENFNDTEYRAKTKRKTISVEELKAQMDWILHKIVIKNIDETLKEFLNK